MLAIQLVKGGFDKRWIAYCDANSIPYKIVDCYANDIIEQLDGCLALMWQFHQADPRDIKFAKQLLYAVQLSGKKVFPDFNTMWHFDDKVGQKYVLEAIGAPLVPSWVFYDKTSAMQWAEQTSFPKVFKLRGGAGSQNVHLVPDRPRARRLIRKAFGRGFDVYNATGNLKERWRKYGLGQTDAYDVFKGFVRLFVPTLHSRYSGREKGYIYFQEFIPDNLFDLRVIVVGDKAFAVKRKVRKNDFRASGSGDFLYGREHFDSGVIRLAFDLNQRLRSQCTAFDFIYQDGNPLLVEISYGFTPEVYDPCVGYWDRDLGWFEGSFDPFGWMIEDLLEA